MDDTPTLTPTEQHSWLRKSWKLGVFALLLIAVAALAVAYSHKNISGLSLLQPSTAQGVPFVTPLATSTPSSDEWAFADDYIPWTPTIPANRLSDIQKLLGTSTPKVHEDAYHLFVESSISFPEGMSPDFITYYNDGVIDSGTYAGYHRIVAEVPPDGIGTPDYEVFATKDYQTYIVDDDPSKVLNPGFINTAIVTKIDRIPSAFASSIPVSPTFALEKGLYYVIPYATTSPSKGGTRLSSPVTDLTLYSNPGSIDVSTSTANERPDWLLDFAYFVDPSPEYSNFKDVITRYVGDTTLFTACGKGALCFGYHLSFADFTKDVYKPSPYEYGFPDTYRALEVSPGTQDPKFYSTYGNLFPFGCGGRDASWTYTLKNISDTDVVDTGRSWQGVELFALANPESSPIVHAVYDLKKATNADKADEAGLETVHSLPDFKAYTSRYPVLLIKDPWGRWVALGEGDYWSGGGCGKPVIYLYPTNPTAVRLSFKETPRFKADIPTYHRGWKVLAQPDGTIIDLQPQYTNCDLIDSGERGSEYAASACAKNKYPYIYWSGVVGGEYPQNSTGWIIPRASLETSLITHLREIGLTDTESRDMRAYWIPQLLKDSAPYYRVSFFTTTQMNNFIPMQVSPAPKSVLRVFLDWSPLQNTPAVSPEPQHFTPFVRKGFTMVEWGGLKR